MSKRFNKLNRSLPAILIAGVMLASLVSGCQRVVFSTGTAPDTTGAPALSSTSPVPSSTVPVSTAKPTTAAEKYFSELAAADLGQREIRIAAYHAKNVFPSSAGDMIDDLVVKRNGMIEEKFNVRLNQVQIGGSDFFETLRAEKQSGLTGCDLVIAPADMLDRFITYSMYTNVNTLGISFDKPYYNREAMNAMTTGVITYAVAGSLTDSPENSYCVFYNRSLVSDNGIDDPVAKAVAGEWTWDIANSQSQAVTSSGAKSRIAYGLASSLGEADFIKMMWASGGVGFFDNNPPLNPRLSLESEVASPIIRTITRTRTSNSYYSQSAKQSQSARDAFMAGRTLFYISRVSEYTALKSAGFAVGIAPLPKFSAQQSGYHSYVDNTFQVTYVPVNCPDKAVSGTVIEALYASSCDMLNSAYLRLYMHLYLNSNDEALALDRVFRNQYYDIGYVMGDVYNQFASVTTDTIYRAVTLGNSISTALRQNRTQFARFVTNKIFDYPKEAVSTAPATSAPASTAPASTAPVTSASAPSTSAAPATSRAPASTSRAPASTSRTPATTSRIPATSSRAPVTASVTTGSASVTTRSAASTVSSAPVSTAPASTAPASTAPSTSAPASSAAPSSSVPAETSSAPAETSVPAVTGSRPEQTEAPVSSQTPPETVPAGSEANL